MTIFDYLVFIGAAITLAGFIGLVWCILRVARARRAALPDEELREVVRSVIPLNMAALGLSVIGLMLVIVGIFIG